MLPENHELFFLRSIMLRLSFLRGSTTSFGIKPESLHAAPVPLHHVLARRLRVVTVGEEHALVARRLFVLAHAAGL